MKAALAGQNIDPRLVNETVVDRCMRWNSVANDWDEEDKFDLCVAHIVRYLPRELRRRELQQAPAVRPPDRPSLDPQHGVAYALMVDLPDVVSKRLQHCRETLWKTPSAPFPWNLLGREEALSRAAAWIDQHDGPSRLVECSLNLRVSNVPIRQASESLEKAIFGLAREETWQADRSISVLLRHLADALDDFDMHVLVGTSLQIPDVAMTPNGPHLTLPGPFRTWPVPTQGLLAELFGEVRNITRISGWWSELQTLQVLMTGEPPLPREDQLDGVLPDGRQRKKLSLTHVALLQLMYLLPQSTIQHRQKIWEGWLRAGHLPDGVVTFDSASTSEQWMRGEGERAQKRARAFGSTLAERTRIAVRQQLERETTG